MELEIATDKLERLADVLDSNFYDGCLRVFEDQLAVKEITTDTAKMLYAEIEAEEFETFKPEVEKHLEEYGRGRENFYFVGLNFENLYSVVRKISAENVTLELEESRLILKYDGNSMELPVIEAESEELPIRELEFDTTLRTESGIFVDYIRSLYVIESPIRLSVNEWNLDMAAKGRSSSGSMTLNPIEIEGAASEALYDEKKLKEVADCLKALADSESVLTVHYSDDNPIMVEPTLSDMKLKMLLCPRIEDNWGENR